MGTLSLTLPDGRTGNLQVDDSFGSLSDADKQNFISTVSSQLSQHPGFGADLQGGLHDLGTSASEGLNDLGGIASRNGLDGVGGALTGAGSFIQQHTPDNPAGQSSYDRLSGDLKSGQWSDVPGAALHAAVRALPGAAPVIGAGAVAGPLAAAGTAGALALGPEAYGRAANNGRTTPTTADTLGALPGVAGEALGGALLPGGSKIANPLLRAGAKVASEAAGGALMDASGQLGATVGTDKGASINPYQTAGAALAQGAIGGARGAKELAGAGIKTGTDQLMARTLTPPSSPEDASSVLGVKQDMDAVPGGVSRTVAANNVKDNLRAQLVGAIGDLASANMIDTTSARAASSILTNRALRHNNVLTDADVGELADMLRGAPPEASEPILRGARALNTVSSQSFQNNTTGPVQVLGGVAGRYGGIAYGLAHGNPMEALALAGLGHSPMGTIAGKIGSGVGAMADRALGTNTPTNDLQAINARRMLQQVGIDPSSVTSPLADLRNLRAGFAPASATTGSPTDAVPVNTPIRPAASTFQPDNPANVMAVLQSDAAQERAQPPAGPRPNALAQAQQIMAARAPAEPAQAPAPPPATPGPPAAPMAPTASQMPVGGTLPVALWEKLVANGNPNISRDQVRQAAAKVYSPEQIALLDAHPGGHDIPATIAPIQAQLGGPDEGAPGRPWQYGDASVRDYHEHAISVARQLQHIGQLDAANAIHDIAVNHHNQEAKTNARAALPPEVAKHVPDWLLKQGPLHAKPR